MGKPSPAGISSMMVSGGKQQEPWMRELDYKMQVQAKGRIMTVEAERVPIHSSHPDLSLE